MTFKSFFMWSTIITSAEAQRLHGSNSKKYLTPIIGWFLFCISIMLLTISDVFNKCLANSLLVEGDSFGGLLLSPRECQSKCQQDPNCDVC